MLLMLNSLLTARMLCHSAFTKSIGNGCVACDTGAAAFQSVRVPIPALETSSKGTKTENYAPVMLRNASANGFKPHRRNKSIEAVIDPIRIVHMSCTHLSLTLAQDVVQFSM